MRNRRSLSWVILSAPLTFSCAHDDALQDLGDRSSKERVSVPELMAESGGASGAGASASSGGSDAARGSGGSIGLGGAEASNDLEGLEALGGQGELELRGEGDVTSLKNGEDPRALYSGIWAQVGLGYDDPVGFTLLPASGDALSGTGCGIWVPNSEPSGILRGGEPACGEIVGTASSDRDVTFLFEIGVDLRLIYTIEAHASEDGRRMTGSVEGHPYPVTWLPLYDELWHAVRPERFAHLGEQVFFELSADSEGGDFVPGELYQIDFLEKFMRGDLGGFHYSEMSFPELEGEPIVVGPVPFTEESSPIELSILFEGEDSSEVSGFEARMQSGRVYLFEVVE